MGSIENAMSKIIAGVIKTHGANLFLDFIFSTLFLFQKMKSPEVGIRLTRTHLWAYSSESMVLV